LEAGINAAAEGKAPVTVVMHGKGVCYIEGIVMHREGACYIEGVVLSASTKFAASDNTMPTLRGRRQ
jgi:hypothetical protein